MMFGVILSLFNHRCVFVLIVSKNLVLAFVLLINDLIESTVISLGILHILEACFGSFSLQPGSCLFPVIVTGILLHRDTCTRNVQGNLHVFL